MPKCLMCHTKKAKRECQIVSGLVCSLCCGTTRNEKECIGCQYYKPPQESRKYSKVPYFIPPQMNDNEKFQEVSDYIESAFCSMDAKHKYQLNDEIPLKILERLLDKYHYKDQVIVFDDDIVKKWFNHIDTIIQTKILDIVDIETLVKIIGAIRFVLFRRTSGKREFFTVIHNYVGDENGMRIIS